HYCLAFVLVLAMSVAVFAEDKDKDKSKPAPSAAAAAEQQGPNAAATADRIFYQEAKLVEDMHKYAPMVETYIQNLKPDQELGAVPQSDSYFLGRLILDKKGLNDKSFDKKVGLRNRVLDRLDSFYKMNYMPLGFMQLIFLNSNFDAQHYQLKYLRQQFLGDVRTLVYDVVAKPHFKGPHFVGRIWIEDQDYHIVRLNGTFEP